MPGGLSHYLLADELEKSLRQLHPELLFCPRTLLFGAQAPDVFYGYAFWRKNENLGTVLHRNTSAEWFRCLKKEACGTQERSFVYGYLTHYAFDTVAHPYVYQLSERYADEEARRRKSKFHYRIEADLDVLLYIRLRGERDDRFPFAERSRLPEEAAYPVYKFLEQALWDRFSFSLRYGDFNRCRRDYERYQRYRSDPSFRKRKVLFAAERVLHLPHKSSFLIPREHPDERVLNLAHAPWALPSGGVSTEDFFELFERAKRLSLELIAKFDAGIIDEDFDRHLLSGKIRAEAQKVGENV